MIGEKHRMWPVRKAIAVKTIPTLITPNQIIQMRIWFIFVGERSYSLPIIDKSLHTHTHTQPFYGSLVFVRDKLGEPVPE